MIKDKLFFNTARAAWAREESQVRYTGKDTMCRKKMDTSFMDSMAAVGLERSMRKWFAKT
jgi:hypothetical protein